MVEVATDEKKEEQQQQPSEDHPRREHDSNRIQVSATKKPMYFYVTLAKRLLKEHDEVQLSALGTAVSIMVSVAEILKKEGFVVVKGLSTHLEGIEDREVEGHTPKTAFKPKMTVVLNKSADYDSKMAEEAAHAKERAAARRERAAAREAAGSGEAGAEEKAGAEEEEDEKAEAQEEDAGAEEEEAEAEEEKAGAEKPGAEEEAKAGDVAAGAKEGEETDA